MHAVVVSDKGVRSVRCTPVGGRECPVRDPPPPSPSAERQYPSCDTPSYDPGFRVSRAAPGGERPRLTQTQNRSPFVALLATSPPRNPLSLPLLPLSLSPSPKEARHTRDDIPALLCLGGGKGEEGEKKEEIGGG